MHKIISGTPEEWDEVKKASEFFLKHVDLGACDLYFEKDTILSDKEKLIVIQVKSKHEFSEFKKINVNCYCDIKTNVIARNAINFNEHRAEFYSKEYLFILTLPSKNK
ncbi:hypothetical protein KAS08_00320 [Candidatus Pacearchaeota archaeon]|nr:hypothetical protein [Candidatus Pacearchaeota archaeon]